jgi:acyl carrier protein
MGLDITHFLLEIEATFDIAVPDEDWSQLVTVGDMCDYIVRRKPGSEYCEVLEKIRQLTVNEFSVRPEEVHPNARWVEDLKLD